MAIEAQLQELGIIVPEATSNTQSFKQRFDAVMARVDRTAGNLADRSIWFTIIGLPVVAGLSTLYVLYGGDQTFVPQTQTKATPTSLASLSVYNLTDSEYEALYNQSVGIAQPTPVRSSMVPQAPVPKPPVPAAPSKQSMPIDTPRPVATRIPAQPAYIQPEKSPNYPPAPAPAPAGRKP